MAANAVIGALRVNLGMDSANFQTGLNKSQTAMQRWGAQVTKVSAVAGAAAGAALVGIAVGVRRTIDEMDTLGRKASQQLGIPVDQLIRLRHAAELSGVSFEALATGVKRLSGSMLDMAMGMKGTTSRAFEALGISVMNADGQLKSQTDVIAEMSEKFSMMEDGATKTALAMAIFGKRAGPDMVPLLNAGTAALSEMMAEAEALGLVFDNETGKAAERFNDNLTRLAKVWDGLFIKISTKLLPALERLSQAFVDFAKNGDAVDRMANRLKSTLEFVATQIALIAAAVLQAKAEFAGLAEAWNRLIGGDLRGAWDAFIAGQKESVEIVRKTREDMANIFNGTGANAGSAQAAGAATGEAFVVGLEGAAGKVKTVVDEMAIDAARIFDATRTPLEQYQAQIARLNELLAAGAINQDTYNRAVLQAQDTFDKATEGAENSILSLESVGQTMQQSFMSVFDRLIEGTFNARDAIAGLLSDLARMLANQAFQMLFSSGSGSGSTGGGLLGAFLSSLKLPGFATGGTILPGGAGGIDSQIVAFRKSPSEQVDIYNPRQIAGGGGGVMMINVNVSGARGNREIEEMVQSGVANGIRSYDDRVLPGRVKGITGTAMRRGDF